MSDKHHKEKYRGRVIRRIGLQYHAFVDKVERDYPDMASAKAAIDEMLDRRDHVERTIGAMRSVPYAEAKQQYFTNMQSEGLSEATQRNYTTFFRQFERMEKLNSTKDVTEDLVARFLAKFKAQGTKHTNYMAVRGFVRFCLGRNYLIDRKIQKMAISPGRPTNGKRQMTTEELRISTEWMDKRKSVLKLLWRVATEAGMRTKEAVDCLRKNFNAETGMIWVNSTKNDKGRFVPISEETVRLLKEHMATCESIYLVSLKGKRYTEGAIQSLVKRMRNELNMPIDIGFYSLRKGVSNHAYDIGGPAFEAQMLGHSTAVALTNYILPKPEMMQRLLERTKVASGPSVLSTMSKESVEQFLGQMAKTDREWVKGLIAKAL